MLCSEHIIHPDGTYWPPALVQGGAGGGFQDKGDGPMIPPAPNPALTRVGNQCVQYPRIIGYP